MVSDSSALSAPAIVPTISRGLAERPPQRHAQRLVLIRVRDSRSFDLRGVSSARLYKEYRGAFFNDYKISVPAAFSVFPEELYKAPRS